MIDCENDKHTVSLLIKVIRSIVVLSDDLENFEDHSHRTTFSGTENMARFHAEKCMKLLHESFEGGSESGVGGATQIIEALKFCEEVMK